ncbi:hypothetical protein IQ270_26070 [Microcoleus sp. LEGE 07076]|uniref:hypothetical protein n=1 Tax=Microcoleus sp. LEGE 07076 TaxID=915322 RepID=UPI00187F17C5|nr:hypothetical protein [Microcoleus sp. LEGE 07076]MBE9188015.1 hypothetical protein [Microcoleus sp. LEGE 07076]
MTSSIPPSKNTCELSSSGILPWASGFDRGRGDRTIEYGCCELSKKTESTLAIEILVSRLDSIDPSGLQSASADECCARCATIVTS